MQIPIEDRKNPVKIAFLSDIHTGTFVNKRQLRKIIDQTNSDCLSMKS